MAILPTTIPVPAEDAIATYDFVDLAERTGIVLLYGYTTKETGTIAYRLGRNVFYSDVIDWTVTGSTTASYVMYGDYDYDLSPFNLPATLKGTATATLCIEVVGADVTAYAICKIRKVSGGNESEIANSQTGNVGNGTTIKTTKITIPLTHFKRDDTLRLTIEIWAKDDGASGVVNFASDPQNRDGAHINPSSDPDSITKLEFYIPFRIPS